MTGWRATLVVLPRMVQLQKYVDDVMESNYYDSSTDGLAALDVDGAFTGGSTVTVRGRRLLTR